MNKKYYELFSLDGRNIIVAGGAGQIGFSFCEILADAGANVIIADIDPALGNEKIRSLPSHLHEKIKVYQLDVSKEKKVKEFYSKIKADYSKIYGLVNSFHFKGNTRKLDVNSNFFSEFEKYPLEAWDSVHDVNLRGTFLMCREAIPLFNENNGGVIVNISSTYGNVSPNKNIYGNSGINSPVAYASSKAAIINLTRYLATHLADKNIRVNVLSPGGVYNNQSEEFINNYHQMTPVKRMANPEDYQGSILFLTSYASHYMTGANLIVDGGWTAW